MSSNVISLTIRYKGLLSDEDLKYNVPNFHCAFVSLSSTVFGYMDHFTSKEMTVQEAVEFITEAWKDAYFRGHVPDEIIDQLGFENVNVKDSPHGIGPNFKRTTNSVTMWFTNSLEKMLTYGWLDGYDDEVLDLPFENIHEKHEYFLDRIDRFV